jgi:hypothetical protein
MPSNPSHRAAEDLQVTAVGLGQPEEQTQQCRLPGTVGSDQTMHLALRDVEVDAVKGDDLAKGFADPARPNRKRFVPPIFRWCLRHPDHLGLPNRCAAR